MTGRRSTAAPSEVPGQEALGYDGLAPRLPPAQPQDTSVESSLLIQHRVTSLCERVLETLRLFGPMTDEALALALDIGQNTIRPRRIELRDEGRVTDSGRRGLTKSGRRAILWIAVDGLARSSGDPPTAHTSPRPANRELVEGDVEGDRSRSEKRNSDSTGEPTTLAELIRWRPPWLPRRQYESLVVAALKRHRDDRDAVREVVEMLS